MSEVTPPPPRLCLYTRIEVHVHHVNRNIFRVDCINLERIMIIT